MTIRNVVAKYTEAMHGRHGVRRELERVLKLRKNLNLFVRMAINY